MAETPTRKLRVGIMGVGGIAQIAHLPALVKAHNVELLAACDGAREVLDPVALEAAFAQGGELFARLSRELKHALAEAHELLDGEQRKQLSEWIADGSLSPRFYGAHQHGC